MTAVFTVQLVCVCGQTYPDQPAPGSAKDLRKRAADAGWEVQRHTTGQDVCPPCRIAAITKAASLVLPAEAAP